MTEATSGHKNNIDKKTFTEQERYWLGHLKRQRSSGLSLAAYARSQGLVVNTFYGWHVKLKDRDLIPTDPAAVFHRVEAKETEMPLIGNESLSLRFRFLNGIDCELGGLSQSNCASLLEALSRIRP